MAVHSLVGATVHRLVQFHGGGGRTEMLPGQVHCQQHQPQSGWGGLPEESQNHSAVWRSCRHHGIWRGGTGVCSVYLWMEGCESGWQLLNARFLWVRAEDQNPELMKYWSSGRSNLCASHCNLQRRNKALFLVSFENLVKVFRTRFSTSHVPIGSCSDMVIQIKLEKKRWTF